MAGKLKTAVLGATGYSGLELTKILYAHPNLEKPLLLRRNGDAGDSDLADVFPRFPATAAFHCIHSHGRCCNSEVWSCFSWPLLMKSRGRWRRKQSVLGCG